MASVEELQRQKEALEQQIKQLQQQKEQQERSSNGAAPADDDVNAKQSPAVWAPAVSTLRSRMEDLFDPSSTGVNTQAFGHLRTILTNIVRFPQEAKYRRLRVANPRLSAELFYHPAAIPFLVMLGWTHRVPKNSSNDGGLNPQAAQAQAMATEVQEEDLIFNAHGTSELEEAAGIIDDLIRRDHECVRTQAEFDKIRRSVSVEVRLDKLTATVQGAYDATDRMKWINAVEEFVMSLFLQPDTDFDFAKDATRLLRTIIGNVQRHPEEAKYRLLKHTNRVLSSQVFPIKGTLELLLACVGFQLTSDGLRLPELSSSSHTTDEPTISCPDAAVRSLPLADRLSRSMALVERIDAAMATTERENEERKRAEARELMAKEIAAEKRQMKKEQRAQERKSGASDSACNDDDDGPSQRPKGNRIPIAEALAKLMGTEEEQKR